MITAIGIREKTYHEVQVKRSIKESLKEFLRGLRSTFTNRAFICSMFAYLNSWLVINFVQGNILLWMKYVVKREDNFSYLLMSLQLSATLSLFLNQKISEKLGKKNAYYIGALVLFITLCCLNFVQENQVI